MEHPVLQAEGLAGLVVPDVLREGARTVVRVQEPRPQLGVVQPLFDRVPEEVLDLGTHVDRAATSSGASM